MADSSLIKERYRQVKEGFRDQTLAGLIYKLRVKRAGTGPDTDQGREAQWRERIQIMQGLGYKFDTGSRIWSLTDPKTQKTVDAVGQWDEPHERGLTFLQQQSGQTVLTSPEGEPTGEPVGSILGDALVPKKKKKKG